MSQKKQNGKKQTNGKTFEVAQIGKKSLSHAEIDQKLTPFLLGKDDDTPKKRPERFVPAQSRIARAR